MGTAADPTYPLYPVACVLSAAALLLVLLTSFVRQSWNLGVAFLCFWLLLENLTAGVDAIIWSDNADIKLYIYCDIVSRLQVLTHAVKPTATLVIIRRLYTIVSLRTVELPDGAARRRALAIEWILGLFIPVMIAGPLFYVFQDVRFEVSESVGCTNSPDGSILSILLLNSPAIVAPLISIICYYPAVIRTFYHQNREINQFLRSNGLVSRTNYFRILALTSVDILLTLPFGVVALALNAVDSEHLGGIPFTFGWTTDHTDWEPVSTPYAEVVASGTINLAQLYFSKWTSPALAFTIFGLFGLTAEALATYHRIICAFGGLFGWKPRPRTRVARSSLEDVSVGKQPAHNATFNLELRSQLSFIDPHPQMQDRDVESGQNGAAGELEASGSAAKEAAGQPRVI